MSKLTPSKRNNAKKMCVSFKKKLVQPAANYLETI